MLFGSTDLNAAAKDLRKKFYIQTRNFDEDENKTDGAMQSVLILKQLICDQ